MGGKEEEEELKGVGGGVVRAGLGGSVCLLGLGGMGLRLCPRMAIRLAAAPVLTMRERMEARRGVVRGGKAKARFFNTRAALSRTSELCHKKIEREGEGE